MGYKTLVGIRLYLFLDLHIIKPDSIKKKKNFIRKQNRIFLMILI